MFIIEYTTPALSLSNALDLDLNARIVVTTIDRSQNGRILIEGTSVLATGGQLDIATLAGRPGQPMLIEAFSVATEDPAGVSMTYGIMGPLQPGNTDNAERQIGGIIVTIVDLPGIFDNTPTIIPSQHRLGLTVATGPIRVILQCAELQAGDIENNLVIQTLAR